MDNGLLTCTFSRDNQYTQNALYDDITYDKQFYLMAAYGNLNLNLVGNCFRILNKSFCFKLKWIKFWFELDLNKHANKEVFQTAIKNTVPVATTTIKTSTTTTKTTSTLKTASFSIGFENIFYTAYVDYTYFEVRIPTSQFSLTNIWLGIGFNDIKSMVIKT